MYRSIAKPGLEGGGGGGGRGSEGNLRKFRYRKSAAFKVPVSAVGIRPLSSAAINLRHRLHTCRIDILSLAGDFLPLMSSLTLIKSEGAIRLWLGVMAH